MNAVVVAADIVTPYGTGVDACWHGVLAGKTAISQVSRFDARSFQSTWGGMVPGLEYGNADSLVVQMLKRLLSGTGFPANAHLLLASTKGEIDLLERNFLNGQGSASGSCLVDLLAKVEHLSGARGGGMVISAACTSSSAAAARAAAMIKRGVTDCVLVVACDSVTEFIFSGFSSLMALDAAPARPFDRHRTGLTVGEAAAYALIMSEGRALREKRQVLGTISGWGLSDDANHMTGPSRESEGLILAIGKAMKNACMDTGNIGFISAHGTGTVYNDAMEMRAFRAVFTKGPVPVYSIKGGMGHTMGAAGLVEIIIALRALRTRTVPPTVNMTEPDTDATGWVSKEARRLTENCAALITNSGFSGINTAVVVS